MVHASAPASNEQPPPTAQQQATDEALSDRLRERVREANAQSEANRLSKGGRTAGGR
jgi:hypothetical protein